ncbi:MAG: DUF262 domain-containing protein [Pseudomonadota bacterium]|nr:DUF262 domain-containing protein [Pseudomonadota bacterium]
MKNFDTRVYSIADFLEWYNNNLLELSPDFQRRSVWSKNAKSYLIDTIIRGKPMPKILISQKLQGSKTIRMVVDGQQRLRAIFEFIEGDFKISNAHNEEFADDTFDDLPEDMKHDFYQYELGVDLLIDMSYEEILDIFARINTYTVKLNKQEKWNAIYLGYFKQYAFQYGFKYVRYFLDSKVLTSARVARMAEAELSAELFVALIDGVQTNKNTEKFYKQYEDERGDLDNAGEQYDNIMSFIGSIYPADELAQTNWKRIHLFYTLFTVVGHMLYGLDGLDPDNRVQITKKTTGKLRVILDEISHKYDTVTEDPDLGSEEFNEFVDYSRRRTTDTKARIYRADFVCDYIKKQL